MLGLDTFECDNVGVDGRRVTFDEFWEVERVVFLIGEDGLAVVRREGGFVRTVVTVLRVVVAATAIGFLVVGWEEETGTF